jgi:HlyD family secretion protein
MRKRLLIIGLVLAVGIAVTAIYRLNNPGTLDALVLSGNVEVTEVNIGFKIPGRVISLYTDEGRTVNKGDKIADLDSAELESMVTQNRASVLNAEAQLDKAKNDFERFTKLYQESVISPQQMDTARTAYDVADSQLKMSRAALRTSEVRLRDAVIYSTLNGIVLRKNIEAGETVVAGTSIFTVGDLENPWIKVYVKEDKLGLVKLGQTAQVMTDSYPGKKYEGTVAYISSEAEFTPKNVQTKEERVKLVFGVKVNVKNVNNELKPGMPADVKIPIK